MYAQLHDFSSPHEALPRVRFLQLSWNLQQSTGMTVSGESSNSAASKQVNAGMEQEEGKSEGPSESSALSV